MARTALRWGVRELAAASKVSTDTISRLERGEELRERTIDALRETFEREGLVFIEADDSGGPGVRLAPAKPKRTHRTKA